MSGFRAQDRVHDPQYLTCEHAGCFLRSAKYSTATLRYGSPHSIPLPVPWLTRHQAWPPIIAMAILMRGNRRPA